MSDGAAGKSDPELAATALQAVANPNRIHLLIGLSRGRSRMDLGDELPISESGISNHLRTMEEAGLVYRTEEGWQVSPLGQVFSRFLQDWVGIIADAMRRIETAKAEAQAEYADVRMPAAERERTVEWRKWELVREELTDLVSDRSRDTGTGSDPPDDPDA